MGNDFAQDNDTIKKIWDNYVVHQTENTNDGICLATGEKTEIARIHRGIKGVPGAQTSGAALVSFNAPAFESYGKEQSYNAPVGKYAEFAYTTALNYLLSNRDKTFQLGDSMVVYWAENGMEEYQKKCFEEKPELAQFQEKFILQVPTDRADTMLRKMRNWYFEAAHQRVSPYQLLTVTEAICKELDLFYRMPEKQEKCPRPLQYRDADLFLDAFEEWIHVYRESLKSQTAGKEKMEEAISYIRENYAKDLNMAMVSNHICMNYSLFSAAFKEHTGVNFVNYLKEIRIAEAKRLLIQTEDKITEIAKQVGFENDKHFMKSFKTACGVSPSEFRKDYKMVSNGKGGQDE